MEYIVMTPLLQSKTLNVTLIERKSEISDDEERGILHKAGGQYTGFIVNKSLLQPIDELEPCQLSFKLNVYMKHAQLDEIQQVGCPLTATLWLQCHVCCFGLLRKCARYGSGSTIRAKRNK
jgi:hypothetical protein